MSQSTTWTTRQRHLRYYLGEFPLWTWRFRAECAEGEWTRPDAAVVDPPCPVQGPGVVYLDSQPVEAKLAVVAEAGDRVRYAPRQYQRFFIRMEGATFEEYLAKFSSKSRATLRAKARKFPDWRSYSSPDEMADFHRIARAISERTYQEKLHDAGLPASAAFLDEARRLAAEDRVRAYLLFHEGRAVAYLYCPVHDGVLVYEYLGYDPEFAKLSPGTALQYLALEKLFAEGRYRLFDFTQGEGSHKEYFSNGSVFCADIYWFPATLGNRLRVRAHHGLDRFSGRVVALLDRMGLKERVKRWLRRA